MTLTPGSKLGPYEIVAQIGKGGMGEVYKAHDPRLRRDVAIKVSAQKFDERFDREARAVAALNHPNICTLYDVGPNYLVMEFIEGETPKGPLPLDEVLRIMGGIAEALEAAHEKGITHRDLKPGNVMVRSDGSVKVLDFGLAQHVQQHSSDTDVANSPTLTMGLTAQGAILGTAAYMAPEQARGKKLDKRADIWAYGVVFYELLTGQRLFRGEDLVEILAAVVNGKPDLSSEQIPANVRRVLERCLEKDPRKRLRDITGVAILLEAPEVNVVTPAITGGAGRQGQGRLAWGVAGVFALVALGTAWALWPAQKALLPLTRLEVDLGGGVSLGATQGADAILSPDGSRLLYFSAGKLYMLRLDQPRAAPVELPGTIGGNSPFFSPDGKWVGFFKNGLQKISVDGGAAVTLTAVASPRGATWGSDGSIIAAMSSTASLMRVPEGGGTPTPLTKLAAGETSHRWPQVLPGGQAVLFTVGVNTSTNYDVSSIAVASLKDGIHKIVQNGGTYGRYVAASDGSGYLTFINRGALFAVPFDLERLEVRGTPSPLLEDIGYSSNFGYALLDFSANGTLVYRGGQLTNSRIVQWMNAAGKTETILPKPDAYLYPRLSPDGTRLSMVATEGGSGQDVWVYDVRGGRSSRLTTGVNSTLTPIWTPDGRYVLYQGGGGIFWTRGDGASQPQVLVPSTEILYPWSISPDGKRLAYVQVSPEAGYGLWTVSLDNSGAGLKAGSPEKYLVTPTDERQPSFSPDGRWIAYASNETGVFQIYVRAFPDAGGKWTISSGGGVYPVFSPNGGELFYRTEEGQVMFSRYSVKGDAFVADPPKIFSEKKLALLTLNGSYDVAPDGRIVGLFPAEAPGSDRAESHVTFLLNFADEIRRRLGK